MITKLIFARLFLHTLSNTHTPKKQQNKNTHPPIGLDWSGSSSAPNVTRHGWSKETMSTDVGKGPCDVPLAYPTQPSPTLSYPILPYPTLPYPLPTLVYSALFTPYPCLLCPLFLLCCVIYICFYFFVFFFVFFRLLVRRLSCFLTLCST